jgi:Cys-tRNA(Pro)/Cys-tRNA(Cys) deacylase
VIPVERTLDLKRAARAVGVKSLEMIPVADIDRVTGYLRGGCSPVGMKKEYRTVIDISCESLPDIVVSAGKIGLQMELAPADLIRVTGARTDAVTTE